MLATNSRILIINLAFIGDVLLSTSVARALREHCPQAVIDMLTIPLTQPIAAGNPFVNDVLIYDKRGRHKSVAAAWKLAGELRRRRYDLAVCTNFAPRGAMLARAAGIPRRLGYRAQRGEWFLTGAVAVRRDASRHESEHYLDVLAPLGISTTDTSLAFSVCAADSAAVRQKVVRDWNRPLTLLCPVGSYPQKSWTRAGYARLLRELAVQTDCYLIGGAGEAAELQTINQQAGNVAGVLAGVLTLGELAALLKAARLLVTVDTGPMHLAGAVGTPVAAFFGPTDPRTWGPRGDRDEIFRFPADCAPCWGRVSDCDHRCLEKLEEEKVIHTILNMLK
ncbi:MAG TPA: lipopolysaccharide heptosyltransferase II [Patescibacteria group bacterium]|nr:lipopolysaccharide heptosyltransferase II [Patescibacteria group bacterium]